MSAKTNIEIRNEIDALNERLKKVIMPSQFVLNNSVVDIIAQIKVLQEQCHHEFDEDNFCIYCDLMKEEDNE